MEKRFTGTVVRATGSWYEVRRDGEIIDPAPLMGL